MNVFMIGPEIPQDYHIKQISTEYLTLLFFKETFHDFKWNQTQKGLYQTPHLFIAFNSGLHHFYTLWIPTLTLILNSKIPLCLTSHDEEDHLRQMSTLETLQLDLEVVLASSPNPFLCYRALPRHPNEKMAYNSWLMVFKGREDRTYQYQATKNVILQRSET